MRWERADGFDDAAESIVEAGKETIYPTSKHDVVVYYQQTFPRDWQKRLSNDLVEVNGGTTKASSYARNFRPDRINRTPTPAFAEKLAKVGREKLPGERVDRKDLAGRRASVSATISMRISKDKKDRTKKINVTLTARQASKMRHGDLDGVIEQYGGINPGEIVSADIERFEVNYL